MPAMWLLWLACTDPPPSDLGDAGLIRFALDLPSPVPAGTTVDAELTLRDAATDAPIDDAALMVEPWMPTMGHGAIDATVTASGGGAYAVAWVFSMSGPWQVDVVVTSPVADTWSVDVDVD